MASSVVVAMVALSFGGASASAYIDIVAEAARLATDEHAAFSFAGVPEYFWRSLADRSP